MTPLAGLPVLALADGSTAAVNAAWRAALIARDHRLPLHLLHAFAAAPGVARLAGELRERLGVRVDAVLIDRDTLAEVVRAARHAGLLVLGARRGNPLRELVLGTQAERLLRLCRVPVLVVKRPATAGYRRILVPVDLGAEATQLLALARLFSRDPRLELLHAVTHRDELALRAADLPEVALRRHRNRLLERARLQLEPLLLAAGADPAAAQVNLALGDAATAVLARERAMRAELVVLGKRQRGLLADFLLGGVTQRVLAQARADVLALPLARAPQAAGGAPAAGPWLRLRR